MSGRNWMRAPWRAIKMKSGFGIYDPSGARLASVTAGGHIADLIAAAPSLYEALAATPCTCTTVAGASHGGQTEQLLDELCGRCAALRLAEGDEA